MKITAAPTNPVRITVPIGINYMQSTKYVSTTKCAMIMITHIQPVTWYNRTMHVLHVLVYVTLTDCSHMLRSNRFDMTLPFHQCVCLHWESVCVSVCQIKLVEIFFIVFCFFSDKYLECSHCLTRHSVWKYQWFVKYVGMVLTWSKNDTTN